MLQRLRTLLRVSHVSLTIVTQQHETIVINLTETTLAAVILGFGTLSGTILQIKSPLKYDEHPRHFLWGVAPPPPPRKMDFRVSDLLQVAVHVVFTTCHLDSESSSCVPHVYTSCISSHISIEGTLAIGFDK